MVDVLGLLLACFAGVCNGSFGLIPKLSAVRNAQVPPYAQANWMAQGGGLASMSLALLPRFRMWSWWGLVSGLLFTTSLQTIFPAIEALGLGPACAVWSGAAVLASLAWGVLGAGDRLLHPLLAAPAVACLVAGVAGASLARLLDEPPNPEEEEEIGHDEQSAGIASREASAVEGGTAVAAAAPPNTVLRLNSESERQRLLPDGDGKQATGAMPGRARRASARAWGRVLVKHPAFYGTLAALATGLAGGLILAPMSGAPPEARGLAFMPGLALGALLTSPVYALPRAAAVPGGFEQLGRVAAVVPGLGMGIVWAAGNAAAAAAAARPAVGLVLAYPIMQGVGVAVAEAWGVLLLGELKHAGQRLALAASCCLVVAGIALLVQAKGASA